MYATIATSGLPSVLCVEARRTSPTARLKKESSTSVSGSCAKSSLVSRVCGAAIQYAYIKLRIVLVKVRTSNVGRRNLRERRRMNGRLGELSFEVWQDSFLDLDFVVEAYLGGGGK